VIRSTIACLADRLATALTGWVYHRFRDHPVELCQPASAAEALRMPQCGDRVAVKLRDGTMRTDTYNPSAPQRCESPVERAAALIASIDSMVQTISDDLEHNSETDALLWRWK
jgi:hypothetical protein